MPIQHLSPDDPPERAAKALADDGCVVIDRLASTSMIASVRREMDPFIDATSAGRDAFSGRHTRRSGALIARSPASHEFITHPVVLGTVDQVLAHATTYQLHLTQIIAIGPHSHAQAIHRDQWAFDFFPFPKGYEVQCNTIWALNDFTEENGATRVIPGSHLFDDKLELKPEAGEPAEMEAGSVLLYTGALYHGGGENCSDAVRYGLNITYALSWLRQEENQYLSVPLDVARELPEPLLRLMGYARGAYALGYIDDLRDPIEALRSGADDDGFGDLARVQEQLRSS